MKKVVTNLCIIHQHPRILLGMKKRGFGAGRWNGFGGKVKEGETMLDSLHREVEEEAGIKIKNPELVGFSEFSWRGKPDEMNVHIFEVEEFAGEPIETEEMKPQWFHVDELPFAEMWPDDIYWMPLFLKNKKFKGRFLFGESDVVLEKELEEVESL